jgi:transcriptional regulator with XRE-family HTH domain
MKGSRKVRQVIDAVFREPQISYPFDGQSLRLARESFGVSQKDFARMCGLSLKNLQQMEKYRKEKRMLSAEKRDTIVAVLYILQTQKEAIDTMNRFQEKNKTLKETNKCEEPVNSVTWTGSDGMNYPNFMD